MLSISTRRILRASLIGTSVEFYDFYIYATAAVLVLGPQFFPAQDPAVQLLASYASFGLAFFARPLGAALFGHFGDRLGRKSTLVASLMLMGGSTVAIAFLPTYDMIGWIAPALLCALRFGQGLGLGGEWGGASLLAVENAPPGREYRWGMFPPLGAPIGFIAANGLFLLLGAALTDAQFHAWGWRLPFLASAALVVLGLWVRLKLTETPAFHDAAAHDALARLCQSKCTDRWGSASSEARMPRPRKPASPYRYFNSSPEVSAGNDDVRALSAVVAERREPAVRARHRHLP